MRKTTLMMLLVVVSAITTTLAVSKELPNEVDLQATYCVAIVKDEITLFSDSIPEQLAYERKNFPLKKHDIRSDEAINEMIDEAKFKFHRLQAYLVPRIQYLDTLSLQAAQSRGEEDVARRKLEVISCSNSCLNDSSCLRKCIDEKETSKRMLKCNDLAFLPY